jgi:hypothetical protein
MMTLMGHGHADVSNVGVLTRPACMSSCRTVQVVGTRLDGCDRPVVGGRARSSPAH